MNHFLGQLRRRAEAMAMPLVGVLLLAWLLAACPDCFAQAAKASEIPQSSAPCHTDAAVPVEAAHDCCPELQNLPCIGGECVELTPVTRSTIEQLNPSTPQFEVLFASSAAVLPKPVPIIVSRPPLVQLASVEPPLYLRHCAFLN